MNRDKVSKDKEKRSSRFNSLRFGFRSSNSIAKKDTKIISLARFALAPKALVIQDYEAKDEFELTLKLGDIVEIIEEHTSGLWRGEIDGKIGLFNCKNVQMPKGKKELSRRLSRRTLGCHDVGEPEMKKDNLHPHGETVDEINIALKEASTKIEILQKKEQEAALKYKEREEKAMKVILLLKQDHQKDIDATRAETSKEITKLRNEIVKASMENLEKENQKMAQSREGEKKEAIYLEKISIYDKKIDQMKELMKEIQEQRKIERENFVKLQERALKAEEMIQKLSGNQQKQ